MALYLALDRPEVIVIPRLGLVMWYPAIGLALGMMLAIGPWYAPLVAVAITTAGMVTYHQAISTYGETIGAVAVAGCYWAAAVILRGRLQIDLRLRRRRDVVRYVSVTLLAAVVSAGIGTACLIADHSILPKDFWQSARSWFLGDAIGLLGVAPFFLIHVLPKVRRWVGYGSGVDTAKPEGGRDGFKFGVVCEAFAQLLAIAVAVWLMFGPWDRYQHLFLSFIPVIWIAMRQGIRRAVTGVILLNFVIVVASNLVDPPVHMLSKITLLMVVVSAVGLIVGSEVSERYRIAIDLNQQTTYLNALIQNSPLGIVVFNRQGRVELANVAFEKLLQVDQRELAIGDIATLWLEQMPTVLVRALAGTASHTTVRQRRKDGKVLDLNLHAVPLMVKGRVHGAYAIYEDISEQVRASEAERKHAESLNRLVDELQIHASYLSLLNEMGGRLEACVTGQEAYTVVADCMQKFFPEAISGTLYLTNEQNLMEAVIHRGEVSLSEPLFEMKSCQALAEGKALWNGDVQNVACRHIRRNPEVRSICAPILSVDGVAGTLHLEFANIIDAAAQPRENVESSQKRLAITVAGQIARSLSSLRLREKLREQSIRDPLTGLFNRRFMEESLASELQRAQRRKYSVSLLFLDLDHFKRFNDTFGHDAGDLVLRSIAELTRSFFRASDICCRYGGEEFAVILPEMTSATAAARADALRTEVKHLELRHLDKALGEISISVGIASFPEHGMNGEEMFRMADRALYESKAHGRDMVTIAVPKEYHPA
jgi:diguanylate cyclase (GGDEF)-like protein/PAS domain S-box-containing protein